MFRPRFPSPLSTPHNLFQRTIAHLKLADLTRTIMTPHPHVTQKRVHVKRSHKYKFNGRASYLYAIRKWKIETYISCIITEG